MKITKHGTSSTANHGQACKWCGLTRKNSQNLETEQHKLLSIYQKHHEKGTFQSPDLCKIEDTIISTSI